VFAHDCLVYVVNWKKKRYILPCNPHGENQVKELKCFVGSLWMIIALQNGNVLHSTSDLLIYIWTLCKSSKNILWKSSGKYGSTLNKHLWITSFLCVLTIEVKWNVCEVFQGNIRLSWTLFFKIHNLPYSLMEYTWRIDCKSHIVCVIMRNDSPKETFFFFLL